MSFHAAWFGVFVGEIAEKTITRCFSDCPTVFRKCSVVTRRSSLRVTASDSNAQGTVLDREVLLFPLAAFFLHTAIEPSFCSLGIGKCKALYCE